MLRPTVLLAHSSDSARQKLKAAARKADCSVIDETDTAGEVIPLFKQHEPNFVVVGSDFGNITGVDIVAAVNKLPSATDERRVVFVGPRKRGIANHLSSVDIDGYISKPVKMLPTRDVFRDVREHWIRDCRATLLHPDGRTARTGYGKSWMRDDGKIVVKREHDPGWNQRGLELVLANRRGDVETAFSVRERIERHEKILYG